MFLEAGLSSLEARVAKRIKAKDGFEIMLEDQGRIE